MSSDLTDEEIVHRLICAWNGHDPAKVSTTLKAANDSTREGWMRVYKEACQLKNEHDLMERESTP